ncbi:Outer membrane efflux protein (modular protein) [Desulfamplus magnetovallimortis]|uniref:Outer membrane efflux protein (Modular protein) n=1 Tax=Desulfamplus magnetovallimortis TaxID=1246637 RepID=A0A1W1HFW6_9BACT|nr:TolC family protein [Desulfamplus magnetovallimortis]SLM31377.1 Outer membrane efflux protein (modular protein) [Desulfamplus magnetovallimortis]
MYVIINYIFENEAVMIKKFILSTCTTMCLFVFTEIYLLNQANAQLSAHSSVSEAQKKDLFSNNETISLSEIISYTLENNPAIQISRERWQQTEDQYPVAISLPDPQFIVTWFPRPIETRMGPQDWNASISQMIPFPGKLATSGKLVETDVAVAKLKTDATAQNIAFKVAASFHELLYIRQAIAIAEKNLELLQELRLLAETGYAEDKSLFIDVIKTQSKLGQISYDLLLLKELEQTETTAMNALLNRSPDAFIGDLEPPPITYLEYPLEQLYQMADESQEEIAISRLNIKKAEIGVDMAEYVKLPDFKLGLFYASIGNPDVSMPPVDAGEDAVGIQFGLTLPIWAGKNNSRISQARSRVTEEKADASDTANSVRSQIRSLYFKLNNSRRLISLYSDTLLPQAQQSMTLAGNWFQEGKGTFADFVEIQSSVYNFQLSIARARADYGKTMAQIQTLVGKPVDYGYDSTNRETLSQNKKHIDADNHQNSGLSPKAVRELQEAKGLKERSSFITLSPDIEKKLEGIGGKGNAAPPIQMEKLLQNSPGLPLLEGIVLKRNAGIKAAKAKVQAEMNAFTQVENLDQILYRYSAFTEALMNGVGPMESSEPISKAFPFPGVSALKGRAAAQSVKIALAELGMAEREAITAMRKAFWQGIYLDKAYTITSETLELFRKLHKVADSLYQSGKTSFQDVIKITIKLNLLEDNIVSIHESRLNIKSEMLALMDLPRDLSIGVDDFPVGTLGSSYPYDTLPSDTLPPETLPPDTLPPDTLPPDTLPPDTLPPDTLPPISTIYAMAFENRHELIKIRAMITKMEQMLEMAETMILPEPDPGFSRYDDKAVSKVGSAATNPAFATSISPSRGAGSPLKPWIGTTMPWLEQTREEIISLGHTLENKEAETRKMVRNAWSDLEKAIRSARVYGDSILDLSSSALGVSTREYEAGRLTFSEVTASYSEWLNIRLAQAGAIRDIGIARAELQRITGKSF